MNISELIERLEAEIQEHGDLEVAVRARDEYWGYIDSKLQDYEIAVGRAQTHGPKQRYSEECLIISAA